MLIRILIPVIIGPGHFLLFLNIASILFSAAKPLGLYKNIPKET